MVSHTVQMLPAQTNTAESGILQPIIRTAHCKCVLFIEQKRYVLAFVHDKRDNEILKQQTQIGCFFFLIDVALVACK